MAKIKISVALDILSIGLSSSGADPITHYRRADWVDARRNEHGVELNLIFNTNAGDPDSNILLMDVPDKFAGYTHMALRVASIPATIAALRANDIAIHAGAGQLWPKRASLRVRARP